MCVHNAMTQTDFFQYIRGTARGNLCLIIKNATGWLFSVTDKKENIALIYSLMARLWKLLLTFDLSDIKQTIFSRPATFITAPTYPQGVHVLNFMGLSCRTTLSFNYLLYYLLILDLFGHSEGILTCQSCFFISFMCCSVWPLCE